MRRIRKQSDGLFSRRLASPADDLHDLDAVAAFVVFDGFASGLPARDTGLDPLALQGFAEPTRIAAPAGEQPADLWQTAQERRRAGAVADLIR